MGFGFRVSPHPFVTVHLNENAADVYLDWAQVDGMVPRMELMQAQSEATIAKDDAVASKKTAEMYEKR